jgi:phosphonate degradation associated HDIG domain protein
MDTQQVIDDVFKRFHEHGHRQYGESVTETEHALQCATFAHQAGETPLVVAACLLHDYGHLCHDLGEDIAHKGTDAHHEDLGATQLRVMFVEEVVEPVRLHVIAKRYLCWKERSYLDGLSEASRRSLHLQGGPMSDAEAAEFEKNPHYDAAVRVRRYDDMGKMPEMATLDLETFRTVLEPFVKQAN